MNRILIIGAGLAGCTAALELADKGHEVILLEKSGYIGGKVRQYGCMASSRCNNCGLCLVGQLWERVERHETIHILAETQLKDVIGSKGNFKASLSTEKGTKTISEITAIIVATGFEEFSAVASGSLEYEMGDGIINGYGLEKIMAERGKTEILAQPPKSIAFIQCFGSRDVHEKALYCSRVCCGYSTRAARVFRHYYPDTQITFFYMDLQRVEAGDYFSVLSKENIEFVRCRPVKIFAGKPARVAYEHPGVKGIVEKEFDLVVLSEGIHPSEDAKKIAELLMLGQDGNGFLKCVQESDKTGIYLAGCASGPKRIEEVHAEALETVRRLVANV